MQTGGWIEKRRRIRLDIARSFSGRSAISFQGFLGAFYDAPVLPAIREFHVRYIPDADTLTEILSCVARATGLRAAAVASLFSGNDTFPRFGERLLRAGAYAEGAR